jgi:hypothetical protein
VDEVAWLARDDLRPFGLMCARMAWRGMSRRFRAGKSGASQSGASQSSSSQSSARGPSALLRAAGGPRYRPGPRADRAARPVRPGPDAWSHNTEFSNEGERV